MALPPPGAEAQWLAAGAPGAPPPDAADAGNAVRKRTPILAAAQGLFRAAGPPHLPKLRRPPRPDAKLIALLLVYFTVFVDILGVGFLMPVTPFLIGAQPHKDSFSDESMGGLPPGTAMSLALVSFNSGQLLSALAFGPLSDRFGRKPLLLASLLGGAVGFALQGVAITTGSFAFFIGTRIFTGLFGGSRPVAIAYIADTSPPDQRARLLGMLALSVTLALQFGPVLGGSLGTLKLYLPCFAAAGVSAVGFFLVLWWVIESKPRAAHRLRGSSSSSVTSESSVEEKATARTLVGFGLCTVVAFAAGFWIMGSIFGFGLLMPVKFGFNPNEVGLSSMGDGLMVLVGNPIYLTLIKKLQLPTIACLGCTITLLTALCPFLEVGWLMTFRYISTIGITLAMPTTTAITTLVAPPNRRGTWTGLNVAANLFGRALAPMVLGPSFDVDYHLPFILTSCVTACGAICSVVMFSFVDPPKASQEAAAKAPQELTMEEAEWGSDITGTGLSQATEQLVLKLREEQAKIQLRLDALKDGKTLQPLETASAEELRRAKLELSDWLVQHLESQGYTRWATNLAAVKLIIHNSFPRVRTEPHTERLLDLINVFENHIVMAEHASYHGAEDLVRARSFL